MLDKKLALKFDTNNRTLAKSFCVCFSVVALSVSAGEYTVVAEFASEPVFNGVSQSPNDPIARVMIEWDNASGFFAGAMAYTGANSPSSTVTTIDPITRIVNTRRGWMRVVEYNGSSTLTTSRSQGISGHVGWFQPIGEDQALQYSLTHIHFPGDFNQSWDYQELQISYHFNRDVSLDVAYSDDYYGGGSSSHLVAFNWKHIINDEFYTFANLGVRRFNEQPYTQIVDKIEHRSLGFGYIINDDWDFKLSVEYADEEVEIVQGDDSAGTRILASFSYLIF